jgi:hypothetical protein
VGAQAANAPPATTSAELCKNWRRDTKRLLNMTFLLVVQPLRVNGFVLLEQQMNLAGGPDLSEQPIVPWKKNVHNSQEPYTILRRISV